MVVEVGPGQDRIAAAACTAESIRTCLLLARFPGTRSQANNGDVFSKRIIVHWLAERAHLCGLAHTWPCWLAVPIRTWHHKVRQRHRMDSRISNYPGDLYMTEAVILGALTVSQLAEATHRERPSQ
jgi:hypothetical protein